MKFEIGDLVKLIHTGQEGKIVSVENKEMYNVEVDGVVFPVFKDHIDHPYFDWFTTDKQKKKNLKKVSLEQLPKEKETNALKIPKGFYLSFFPMFNKEDLDIIDGFKIYLINETAQQLQFEYVLKVGKETDFKLKGMIYPFTNFYVHNISFENLQEIPEFIIGYGIQRTKDYQKSIKIKAKKLIQYIDDLFQNEQAYFSILLENYIVEKPLDEFSNIQIGSKNSPASKYLPQKLSDSIDLHAEALGLKNTANQNDILDKQLNVLSHYFEQVEHSTFESVTIIHGVGEGILKNAVHQFLKGHKIVRYYISDWMPQYGYGATQVFLQH